jgi:Zn-dependent M28 family amino/carboxypeptidase
MRKTGVLIAVLLAWIVLAPAQTTKRSDSRRAVRVDEALPASAAAGVPPIMNQIDPEKIRAHVKFLSSDLLEGRGTGQRGGDIAAEYIATQLQLYGLKPAGDNGSYMQKVPMVGIQTLPEQTSFEITGGRSDAARLRHSEDFVATNETQEPTVDIDAEIVYVGYGISAPEYNWDDYKGADLKGKVLLMLVNEPPSTDAKFFKGPALTYYGRWTYKYEEAARRGAAGVLLVHKTEMASYGWDVVKNSWGGERSFLRDQNRPKLREAGWVQLNIADKIAQGAGKNLNDLMRQANTREFKPLPLGVRLKAHLVSRIRPFDSENVLAKIDAAAGPLSQQAVIYSAHFDHLGIGPEKNGDKIYNGAADNGTGCGMLLEMARVWAQAPKPKRTVFFAAVTAEEQGLLGSEYLGLHPPAPAGRISLGLNFDNLTPYGIPEAIEVTGAERSTFYPVLEQTAKEFRLKIQPDSRPEAGHYYRSDHFSLARVGIPAFSVNEGDKFQGHDEDWGKQQKQDYTANRYHTPQDEYRDDMDFRGDALLARFGFALGWRAANQPTEVQWQPGDEFEKARKSSGQ